MRADGGLEVIKKAGKLEAKHDEHIKAYGEGSERRLTGAHETASIDASLGLCEQGASVRVGRDVEREGKATRGQEARQQHRPVRGHLSHAKTTLEGQEVFHCLFIYFDVLLPPCLLLKL